jgi:hypothetical protein
MRTMKSRRVQASAAVVRVLVASAGVGAACSPASEAPPAPLETAPESSESGGAASGAGDGAGVSGLVDESEESFVPVNESDACVAERAERVESKEPVDIILIIDNSASMQDELAATERNINVNFASILEESGLDYRVIALTLHRRQRRTGFGQSATMLCVERPLSALPDCTAAAEPRFSDRFFQYSTRIESDDSFDILLDTYAPPFDNERRQDEYGNAPNGWSEWLRPGIQKVFLELSDGNEDMPAADFERALAELDPAAFGADPAQPAYVFHSIVNIAPKAASDEPYYPDEAVEAGTCDTPAIGESTAGLTSGEVYQELSRVTGGLRFPICLPDAYDVVFREIAGRVIQQSDVACDFPVPQAPAGREIDLDRVSVTIDHEGTGADATVLGQARVAEECDGDAFFIRDARIQLCPDVCAAVRGEEGASVGVLFGCESTIIVR